MIYGAYGHLGRLIGAKALAETYQLCEIRAFEVENMTIDDEQ